MIKKDFWQQYEGKDVFRFTIQDKIAVVITNFGGRVLEIWTPDKNGVPTNVALCRGSIEEMMTLDHCMGATIGRVANRISGGGFTLNGQFYPLYSVEGIAKHGGKVGFDRKVFDATINEDENAVILSLFSPDGDEGYLGNLDFKVKFSVKDSKLSIEYYAESDKDTLLNVTNHAYFNLNGEHGESVLNHYLKINSDGILALGDRTLPTGDIRKVEGTPFDFREFKTIGQDIDADDDDLKAGNGGGYDHNYCINGGLFAEAYSPITGIKADFYTDMPGVQLFSGNNMKPSPLRPYFLRRQGFCLETQFYPDAINHPNFPQPVLKKGEKFYSRSDIVFSLIK